MKSISVDIESYSSINLTKSGVFRYCEAEDFEVLLFGCSIDGSVVRVYMPGRSLTGSRPLRTRTALSS